MDSGFRVWGVGFRVWCYGLGLCTCLSNDDSRWRYDECGFDEDNINTTEVDQFVDAFFGEGARNVDGRSPDWNMSDSGGNLG